MQYLPVLIFQSYKHIEITLFRTNNQTNITLFRTNNQTNITLFRTNKQANLTLFRTNATKYKALSPAPPSSKGSDMQCRQPLHLLPGCGMHYLQFGCVQIHTGCCGAASV